MKLHAIPTFSALGLAIALTACGGGQADPTITTAAATLSTGAAQIPATMPAPDCAADGCRSLRIIDANAEAYRYDAMRRAAAEQAASASNS